MGDGGSAGDPNRNGQNPDTLLAKILTFDVDAFAAGKNVEPVIWDTGVRNPWRFSFDRETGDLFIADVGQGMYEEIDAEPAGQGGRNYGWSEMEGPACYRDADCDQSAFTPPVAAYRHAGNDCSVTGGYVYRGSAIPELVGTYVYGDFCSGIVRGIDAATAISTGAAVVKKIGDTGMEISAFGQDAAGELYILGLEGQIVKITGLPANPLR
jgi:glucose/arabinose dehydrogenase